MRAHGAASQPKLGVVGATLGSADQPMAPLPYNFDVALLDWSSKVVPSTRAPISRRAPPSSINMGGRGEKWNTPQVLKLFIPLFLAISLGEFRVKVVVFGSPRLLRSLGMSSSLALLCNP